ncbi:MAG: hypothetical protein LWX56_06465 [Ignavibacteria bacterium]|nr:hypothetical protein [Ignavibacteria bacterium]
MNKLTDKVDRLDIKFCTECGDELDEFTFSKKSKNTKRVQKRHQKCRDTGKFNGEMCSKMFIVKENEDTFMEEDD